MKDRGLLLQIGFDLLDSNNDGKISQLDLFKFILEINRSPFSQRFTEKLYLDIVTMQGQLDLQFKHKLNDNLSKNEHDE